MNITKNKILITGGTKGIGREMAERFLSLGNHVIITGRNTYALNSMKESFPQLDVFQCDLTNHGDIEALVTYIREVHPGLNVLINNAGVQFNFELDSQEQIMHRVNEELSTNLIAPINLATALIPTLQQNKGAAIVNVSSALAFVPKQSAPIYSASKAGLHNFTKVLRYQLEGRVSVFELIPPLVDTAMTDGRNADKISTAELVDAFISAYKDNQFEINVGKVKVLRLLHRIYPRGAERLMRFK